MSWINKLRFRKLTWVIIIVIILVLLTIINRSIKKHELAIITPTATLLNKSDISVAKIGAIDSAIKFTGDLRSVEQTVISAEVDARIDKVWVDEGQVVKLGQVLADLDTLDLAQAVSQQEAALATAKAKLALSKQKMDKNGELLKQGFISQIAYDELSTDYQAALQNYKAQDALLTRSKKQLSNTHVVAPFAGVIYQKNIEQGQLALKNTKLFALANLSALEIKAAISSDKINQVKIGQIVTFKVEADDHVYSGVVSRINQVAEPGTRAYLVYINFDNRVSSLKGGQFVKGQIILEQMKNQLVIACDSIRDNGNGKYILVLSHGKIIAKPIKITLDVENSNRCAVTGAMVGDEVLAGNVLSVKAGDVAKLVD